MKSENSSFEKVNNWIRNSVTLKLFVIVVIMILLLIPAEMIKSIISEREKHRDEAVREVSFMWADQQLLNGPILAIPVSEDGESNEKGFLEFKYLKILPEELQVKGFVYPKTLRRGIYDVIVYSSEISIRGIFDLERNLHLPETGKILYDQAFLSFGISDLRGIKDEIKLKWAGREMKVSPGSKLTGVIQSGISVDIPDISPQTGMKYEFQMEMNLQGSRNISFIPLGSITRVELSSTWPYPSFNGNFLPDQREVNQEGFKAFWKILQLNRNFPQSWIDPDQSGHISNAAFGVDLIQPVDDYQKSLRSAKYAIMAIALTFLVFFLVEILDNRKIHPFQYGLVGLALCLFYLLLVSISEQSNFNFAYLLSSAIVILLISLYSLSIFKVVKISLILTSILVSVYGFLFTILQLADYSLLLGSVGLTIIMGLTMYFTRNINWYQMNNDQKKS